MWSRSLASHSAAKAQGLVGLEVGLHLSGLLVQKEPGEFAALGNPSAPDFLCGNLSSFQEVESLAWLRSDEERDCLGTPHQFDRILGLRAQFRFPFRYQPVTANRIYIADLRKRP